MKCWDRIISKGLFRLRKKIQDFDLFQGYLDNLNPQRYHLGRQNMINCSLKSDLSFQTNCLEVKKMATFHRLRLTIKCSILIKDPIRFAVN